MYKYTTDDCFKGKLLKEPPLPADDPRVLKQAPVYKYITRRWLHNGCAVEEIGRFGNVFLSTDPEGAKVSAFVYRVQDLLSNPHTIENNDGYHPDYRDPSGDRKKYLFMPRFVLAALNDSQIRNGIGTVLEEYFGFKQLAPYFANTEKYGNSSRVGLWGVCTTRYVVDEKPVEKPVAVVAEVKPKAKKAATKEKVCVKKKTS